jgi:hypothetical protein
MSLPSVVASTFSKMHTASSVDHVQCKLCSFLILNIVCLLGCEEAILGSRQSNQDLDFYLKVKVSDKFNVKRKLAYPVRAKLAQ